MSARHPSGVALSTLAERVCAAAGTDLAAVLTDLHHDTGTPGTPAALRAGWALPDTVLPEQAAEASA